MFRPALGALVVISLLALALYLELPPELTVLLLAVCAFCWLLWNPLVAIVKRSGVPILGLAAGIALWSCVPYAIYTASSPSTIAYVAASLDRSGDLQHWIAADFSDANSWDRPKYVAIRDSLVALAGQRVASHYRTVRWLREETASRNGRDLATAVAIGTIPFWCLVASLLLRGPVGLAKELWTTLLKYWRTLSTTEDDPRAFVVVRLGAALMALWAIGQRPYEHYVLLRWVVCPVAAFVARQAHLKNMIGWSWAFGVIAALFNPLIPVHLDRSTWGYIDFIVAGLLVGSIPLLAKSQRPSGGG